MTERMKTSLDAASNRAREIERKNFELGGFLNIYAKLPVADQKAIMREVNRLREELAATDPELYLERIRAMSEVYGAVSRNAPADKQDLSGALTWRLGEIERSIESISKGEQRAA